MLTYARPGNTVWSDTVARTRTLEAEIVAHLGLALAARVARVASPTPWAFGVGAALVFLAFAVLLFFAYA